jgi:hypothetical protein
MSYSSEVQLGMLSRELGLDEAGLAELLGLSETELGRWRADSVPAADAARFEVVCRTVTMLVRKLKLGRVSSVARKPAETWEGRTLLEMLRADPNATYLAVERMFDPNRLFD